MNCCSKKCFTAAIIGCGQRGLDTYATHMQKTPEKFRVVSVCDKKPIRLELAQKQLGLSDEVCFLDEKDFFAEKRADVLLVCTLDQDHVRMVKRGLELGYDVLCEKPITDSKQECMELLEAQKKAGRTVAICHVLRYAPAFCKVDELLDEGTIGRLVAIDATEQVAYWHQAHSFVRGNWRRSDETVPMILAKSCHDLDLLQHYARSKCKTVSSVGDLTYFKAENAPAGAAKRCYDCPYVETCRYSAKLLYLTNGFLKKGYTWPHSAVSLVRPMTAESLEKDIKEGPYGRCVFYCDNDVVDHQLTQLVFENGVKTSFTMTAFTAGSGRIMYFRGTEGEIILNEETDSITIKRFGEEAEIIDTHTLITSNSSHGGGDEGLLSDFYERLVSGTSPRTTLEASVESHLIGIAAEESRRNGGRTIELH